MTTDLRTPRPPRRPGRRPTGTPVIAAPATPTRRLRGVTPGAGHAERQPPPALPTAALVTLLVGVLLPVTDFFIVNVALPTMAATLHASDALLELVVAGYGTGYAVLLVLGGRLGDAFGRRRLFLTGMVAFTVMSLLCGLAPNAAALVVLRVLQGASAALMVPQTLATIQATGTAESRARAVGWYGATAGIAGVLGQVAGGVLVSANIAGAAWRPIFLVNVPVGIAGLVFARRHVPETRSGRRLQIDAPGTALLAVTIAALLVPLTEGAALGWPVWSWVTLGLAPVAGAAFVLMERRQEAAGRHPLLPPSVVALPTMRSGLAMIGPFFAGFAAFLFVYALILQGPGGFSPLTAGLTMVPLGTTFLLASLQMPRLTARWGQRVVAVGALIQLAGLAGFACTLAVTWPQLSPAALAPSLAVIGTGQGLVVPALVRRVLSDVPAHLAGAGSGVLTTTQQISLALGVATLGTLFVDTEAAARLGVLHAALVVIAAQAAVAVLIARTTGRRTNPSWRTGPSRRTGPSPVTPTAPAASVVVEPMS